MLSGLLLGLGASPPSLAADNPSQAGAYRPFPEPGQKPVCQSPVQARYPEFLSGADSESLDEAATAAVEADLAFRACGC